MSSFLDIDYMHQLGGNMRYLTFMLFLLLTFQRGAAQDWKMLVDFRGQWKFKLGDNEKWEKANFDDSKWDEIFVPANWEDEGYPGYDGYAWYRKHFRVSPEVRGKPLYIHLGCTDDVSEVFLNGHFVSFTGAFPPHYITAYNVDQKFIVPQEYLNFSDDNVIAVRVYDDQLVGGINKGRPGVFEMMDYLYPDYVIEGTWKLRKGDDDDWAKPSFDDSKWPRRSCSRILGYSGAERLRRIRVVPRSIHGPRKIPGSGPRPAGREGRRC